MKKPAVVVAPTHRAVCPACKSEGVGTLTELSAWAGTHYELAHADTAPVPLILSPLADTSVHE
ncbi:MAG: hypothetical protein NVS9B4_00350 [Candidatus Acidiferrum sp.]